MSVLLDSLAATFEGDAARRASLDAVLRDGLPGARSEAWKYTPLRALERRAFAAPGAATVDPAALAAIPAPRMVFVNGRYDAGLTDLAGLPDGAMPSPLSGVLASGDPRDANFLERRYERADEPFARLNAALAREGAVVRVSEGVRVASPLHLVFIGAPAGADAAWHLRTLIELRRDAELVVIEHHLASGAHAHLSNALVHVHLAAGATLRHARIQDEAERASVIARTDAVLARDARYRRIDLELGATLSRHELNVRLEGEAARVDANGVLLATGRRHLDTRLDIEHIARARSGRNRCRGRAVFHGGITIRAGADGSDAALSNKNLLLSEGAGIDTQPVLEIHADEVKAAHGATVGRLDPTALYYLRSRGLPGDEARRLLTAAFCREVLAGVALPAVRERLDVALDRALATLEDA